MKVTKHDIPGVLTLEPKVFCDDRGFFLESFNQTVFQELLGMPVTFVQDNHSCSSQGVLRGMHFQIRHAQGKLVRVVEGEIFDVAVDLRLDSPHFGKWVAEIISAENRKQFWVPAGFAHGFLVLSEKAQVLYKTTDFWAPQYERSLRWDDSEVDIQWPLKQQPILSDKDQKGLALENIASAFALEL